jgi:T4 bacteriophage base plate protein
MALPKLDVPMFEVTLPVSNKKLKFRPFLVKEQKILLMAMESKDEEVIENNIHQILNNCVVTPVGETPIEIDKLPLVDVEYYFLNLRARSVGETVESRYKCENDVGGKPCGNMMDVNFDL